MRDRTRDRVFLPIALPIGLLVLLGAALFGFSRILLSLGHTSATAIALVVAVAIVVVAGLAAARPIVRASTLGGMAGAIAGVALLAGGVALIATPASKTGGAEHGGGAAITISAQNIQFDTSKIDLTANQQAIIRFENKDPGVQHNIAIYEDDSLRKLLFKGDIITGPDTVDYHVPGLPPGTYYFHCDVHPTMTGSVAVAEGGGGETGGGGAGGAGATVEPATVTASGIAFDTSTLTIPARTPSTLRFDNKDAGVSHNIAIYPSESDLTSPLFRGELTTGPATTTYRIPPLDPGSYYFHCDVHPTMNGSATVK